MAVNGIPGKIIKKIVPLVAFFCLGACKTWNEEDKDAFKQACMENARTWAGSEDKAKTYCDCVLEKMMVRYPNENDALEHINELSKDTLLMNCRTLIK